MVQFTLPKNSRVTEGKTWAYPTGAHEAREYRVYRWNPDDGRNPRLDTYYVDAGDWADDSGRAYLDQEQHRSDLTFRRSPGKACGSLRDEHRQHDYARMHQRRHRRSKAR
jgi:succinate dehydrogenase / fumarate reductase iron-sulfur subunit